jgi:hypothetical protein
MFNDGGFYLIVVVDYDGGRDGGVSTEETYVFTRNGCCY